MRSSTGEKSPRDKTPIIVNGEEIDRESFNPIVGDDDDTIIPSSPINTPTNKRSPPVKASKPVPKAGPAPKTRPLPKASPTPAQSNMPKAIPVPKQSNMPRASPIPKQSNMPKASPIPAQSNIPQLRKGPIIPRKVPIPMRSPTQTPSVLSKDGRSVLTNKFMKLAQNVSSRRPESHRHGDTSLSSITARDSARLTSRSSYVSVRTHTRRNAHTKRPRHKHKYVEESSSSSRSSSSSSSSSSSDESSIESKRHKKRKRDVPGCRYSMPDFQTMTDNEKIHWHASYDVEFNEIAHSHRMSVPTFLLLPTTTLEQKFAYHERMTNKINIRRDAGRWKCAMMIIWVVIEKFAAYIGYPLGDYVKYQYESLTQYDNVLNEMCSPKGGYGIESQPWSPIAKLLTMGLISTISFAIIAGAGKAFRFSDGTIGMAVNAVGDHTSRMVDSVAQPASQTLPLPGGVPAPSDGGLGMVNTIHNLPTPANSSAPPPAVRPRRSIIIDPDL